MGLCARGQFSLRCEQCWWSEGDYVWLKKQHAWNAQI
jgi:hypothetical protein